MFKVEELKLNLPDLQQVREAWRRSLRDNFEKVEVEVVACPDLRSLGCAFQGLGGDAVLVDVGGVNNLFYKSKRGAQYTFRGVAEAVGCEGRFVFGAGAAARSQVGVNAELMPNCSCAEGGINKTHFSKVEGDQFVQGAEQSGKFGLLANLCFTEGKASTSVLMIDVHKRTGDKDIVATLVDGLLQAFPDQSVGVGGIIEVLEGSVNAHVMPDFPPGDMTQEDEVHSWLKFGEMSAKLTMLSVFVSRDPEPERLDLRTQHTHFFSEHGHAQGGHYHNDTTPQTIRYRGYFQLASRVCRVDRAFPREK